jgi:DNA-binding winged helix-turn-helix (wHTH) protein
LRGKLQAGGGGEQEWIVTVRGKGYMLGPEVALITE